MYTVTHVREIMVFACSEPNRDDLMQTDIHYSRHWRGGIRPICRSIDHQILTKMWAISPHSLSHVLVILLYVREDNSSRDSCDGNYGESTRHRISSDCSDFGASNVSRWDFNYDTYTVTERSWQVRSKLTRLLNVMPICYLPVHIYCVELILFLQFSRGRCGKVINLYSGVARVEKLGARFPFHFPFSPPLSPPFLSCPTPFPLLSPLLSHFLFLSFHLLIFPSFPSCCEAATNPARRSEKRLKLTQRGRRKSIFGISWSHETCLVATILVPFLCGPKCSFEPIKP